MTHYFLDEINIVFDDMTEYQHSLPLKINRQRLLCSDYIAATYCDNVSIKSFNRIAQAQMARSMGIIAFSIHWNVSSVIKNP